MSINASNDDDSKPGLTRFIVPGGIVLGLIGAALLVHSLMGSGPAAPKRQTVKIAVLPDTPPPPPPPKPEKPPEPKPQDNTPQPQDQPKLAEAPPEPQQLKMEGAAGDGPSAFSAGSVSSDYKGGAIGAGNGASAPSAGDRAKFNFYAKSAQQVLRAELDRTLARDVIRLGARLQIWIDASGRIDRYEIGGLSDAAAQNQVRAAMQDISKGFRLVPPAGLPQPLEMRLSVNPLNG
ncbi:hypothetical protein [Aquabacterium sp. UBA2148]|uniref:hypothetical protein n=1 Tax=Aquabacterium sp. UBA2148 TaxID=1946042 RepID=UPI002579AB5B|nr:hypothetical protein [Aquabacterium sp. UBA2148]